ncbi:antigenic thaumatin-like protein ARB_01183 [Aspergillus awamori]|uniref:Antigenic thaumatin-like protein ARB_01183 n=1 Tax=Aspergillus awamori TaxID=105351 RepID=A0A401L2S7_ASPAW|nr:antigenic thaumatin-like protein ARB_01183 [Aspergillus awamori]
MRTRHRWLRLALVEVEVESHLANAPDFPADPARHRTWSVMAIATAAVTGAFAVAATILLGIIQLVALQQIKYEHQVAVAKYAIPDYIHTHGLLSKIIPTPHPYRQRGDFPCKGYARDPFDSVAEYTAGQEYAITLAGTATHGGGSCQISLSYDMGETFRVIHSILGHCPEPLHYSFRIPEDAPHGPALLAWTWFNKIGNREMYMNCAQVTIQSPISDVGALQGEMQQASRLERPPIFLANIKGEGQCVTIEGEEVSFPMPGDSIKGTVAGGTGYTCSSSAAFLSSVASSPSTMASFIPRPALTTTRPGIIPPGENTLSTQSAPYTVTKKDSSSSTIPADSTGLRYSTGTGTKPDITGHSEMAIVTSMFGIFVLVAGMPPNSSNDASRRQEYLPGVTISNYLAKDIFAWSVSNTTGPMTVIPHQEQYFESWRTRVDGGGISIKLATEPSQRSVLQFEYTRMDPIIYWDVSYIDLDYDSDLFQHNITVTSNDPSCPVVSCAAGVYECHDVYLHPDDNYATHGCPVQTHLELSIGSSGS